RTREVEELEDAKGAVLGRLHRLRRSQPVVVDDDELARRDLALEDGADEVERTRLGRDDPLAVQASEDEWPETERIPEGEQRALRQRRDRVRTLQPTHRLRDRVVDP